MPENKYVEKTKVEDLETLKKSSQNIQESTGEKAVEQVKDDAKKAIEEAKSDYKRSYNETLKYKETVAKTDKQITCLSDYKEQEKKLQELDNKIKYCNDPKEKEKLQDEKGKLDQSKKELIMKYCELSGKDYKETDGKLPLKKGETIDGKIRELKNEKEIAQRKSDISLAITKQKYNQLIEKLPEDQKKSLSEAEGKLSSSGQSLYKLHSEKNTEYKEYSQYMNSTREKLESLEAKAKTAKDPGAINEEIEKLKKEMDSRVNKHNEFENKLYEQEKEHINLRKELDAKRKELGISLENTDNLTEDQKKKLTEIDDMYVGKIPPGSHPVDDMIANDKIKTELDHF